MRDDGPEQVSELEQQGIPGEGGDGLEGVLTEDEGLSSRLVEPSEGGIDDAETDLVAIDPDGDVDAMSPEESAVHIISEDDAPGVTWDAGPGYVDDDAK